MAGHRSARPKPELSSSPQFVSGHPASVTRQRGDGGASAHGAPWAALAAALVAMVFVFAQVWLQRGWIVRGPTNDFLTFYSAAGASDVYSSEAVEAARPPGFAAGVHGTRLYLRPPVHAALLKPLRALPYPSAYMLWQVLMLWCVAGFVVWWRPPGTALTLLGVAISVPLFFAFVRGQDSALFLLAAAGGLSSSAANRPFRAGLWLSALAVQPHALMALPVVLVAQRRWAALRRFGAGLLAWTAASFAAGGWDWPWRFVKVWAASDAQAVAATPSLAGAAAWCGVDSSVVYPAAVLLLVAVYAVSRRESFAAGLGCALAAGLLLAPRAHFEDSVLLLPGALVLLAEKQVWPLRLVAALALTPLGFLLQGGRESVPAVVILGAAMILLAAALPSRRPWSFRRRQLLVRLNLG